MCRGDTFAGCSDNQTNSTANALPFFYANQTSAQKRMRLKPLNLQLYIGVALLVLVSACTSGANTPAAPPLTEPTVASSNQNPTTGAPATIPAAGTRTDRRAPTLAPTSQATETSVVPPTEIPTATSAATNTTAPTTVPTLAASPTARQPLATATPAAAPGVYVTTFRIDPPAPKSKPAEFFFQVGFLNTVGQVVNYPRWRVLILPKGQTKAVGDPQGTSKTIAPAASDQKTEVWSIKVIAGCETYIAQPVWEDEDGRQTPFTAPDGKAVGLEFQVCA